VAEFDLDRIAALSSAPPCVLNPGAAQADAATAARMAVELLAVVPCSGEGAQKLAGEGDGSPVDR
jgi:hypothetical protein